ncbi:conserved exported hypothetical protein [Gammaproteobacteria bacterium]
MQKSVVKWLVISAVLMSSQAFAGADEAWIAKCIKDNARENATPEVVLKYCTCMNNNMSDNEQLSITAWEQSHPVEMAACEKEAGWK